MREITVYFNDKQIIFTIPTDNLIEVINMLEEKYPDNTGYKISRKIKLKEEKRNGKQIS